MGKLGKFHCQMRACNYPRWCDCGCTWCLSATHDSDTRKVWWAFGLSIFLLVCLLVFLMQCCGCAATSQADRVDLVLRNMSAKPIVIRAIFHGFERRIVLAPNGGSWFGWVPVRGGVAEVLVEDQ